jgi:hypothetical protein
LRWPGGGRITPARSARRRSEPDCSGARSKPGRQHPRRTRTPRRSQASIPHLRRLPPWPRAPRPSHPQTAACGHQAHRPPQTRYRHLSHRLTLRCQEAHHHARTGLTWAGLRGKPTGICGPSLLQPPPEIPAVCRMSSSTQHGRYPERDECDPRAGPPQQARCALAHPHKRLLHYVC